MCGGGGGPQPVDTSRQEEEARRQREEDRARAAEERRLQQEEADRRYAQELERERLREEQRQADIVEYNRRLEEAEQRRIESERATAEETRRAREEENTRRETERQEALRVENERAAAARREATERQARIDGTVASVDNAFAGFNDDYFRQFEERYRNYYTPQIATQAGEAERKLTLSLADRGALDSSSAARGYGRLAQQRADAEAHAGNEAVSQSQALRSSINNQKNTLRSTASTGATIGDPSLVAGSIRAPNMTPLGNVFQNIMSTAPRAASTASRAAPGLYDTSSSSYRVVG